jgi:hypothetical protein
MNRAVAKVRCEPFSVTSLDLAGTVVKLVCLLWPFQTHRFIEPPKLLVHLAYLLSSVCVLYCYCRQPTNGAWQERGGQGERCHVASCLCI